MKDSIKLHRYVNVMNCFISTFWNVLELFAVTAFCQQSKGIQKGIQEKSDHMIKDTWNYSHMITLKAQMWDHVHMNR